MKTVYSCEDVCTAHIVQGILEGVGIPAIVHDEYRYGLPRRPCVLIMRDEDYDLAMLRVMEFENPEYVENDIAPDWTCPGCGEHVGGRFTDCWKCGAARPLPEEGT